MPYNPGIQYRGDQYLFQGISGAGDAIAQGVQQFRKDRRESQFLDEQAEMMGRILGQRVQTGQAGGEGDAEMLKTLAGFPSKSLSQKRGALASVMFGIAEQDKAQERAAVQKRADQRNEIDQKQIGLQQAQLDRLVAREDRAAKVDRDSVGLMLALTGQQPLPSPVDPAKAGAYLQSQYPDASADVIARILEQTGPDAQRRLDISEGNLRVAEAQVRNREREVQQGDQPKARTVRVTEKADDSGVAYSYDMPWEEYQALKAEREKAANAKPVEPSPAPEKQGWLSRLWNGKAADPVQRASKPGETVLDAEVARRLLQQAGGDKAKARKLAEELGYKIAP